MVGRAGVVVQGRPVKGHGSCLGETLEPRRRWWAAGMDLGEVLGIDQTGLGSWEKEAENRKKLVGTFH